MIDRKIPGFKELKDSIIIGNWKMYKTATEAIHYIEALAPLVASSTPQVFIAVGAPLIFQAAKAAKGKHIRIGAQNIHDAEEGAFTGEISAMMLKDAGAEFVLIGHSERRQFFSETDEFINRKTLRALQDDLIPVVCIGETEMQRFDGQTKQVLENQLAIALKDVPKNFARLLIAYEPVWAIGTGKNATPDLANDIQGFCRNFLETRFGKKAAHQIPILYGGSVKPENIAEIMKQEHIDGVLVGGSSLKVETFAKIVNY